MATLAAKKEIAHNLRNFSEPFIIVTDYLQSSLKEFVVASITSKLIDQAGDFIFCRPDLKTWPEIKKNRF